MARVLLVEDDPLFAALVEDSLRIAGHHVEVIGDGAQAVLAAREQRADLIILELALVSGVEVLRTLRSQPEMRGVVVLVLAEPRDSRERLAALKAGADEVISKPCEPEEVILRVERLLGCGREGPLALRGNLGEHPLWEVLQYIEQSGKSGRLVVRGSSGAGALELGQGRVRGASWEALEGRSAALTLAGLTRGSFSFEPQEEEARGELDLPLRELILEAARLDDELDRRREHLPATGVPLRTTGRPPPPAPEELTDLPVAAILEHLRKRPESRLYDLLQELDLAPDAIRLAVAWLVEQGVLEPARPAGTEAFPTTTEIESTLLVEAVASEVLAATRLAGFDGSAIACLVLVEPTALDRLREVLDRLPGGRGEGPFTVLGRRLESGRGGSAQVVTEDGKLSLHVQVLKAATQQQLEAIVPVCAGVVVWLDRGDPAPPIEAVVRRLESSGNGAKGVLIAPTPEASALAGRVTTGSGRWRILEYSPKSLLGLLRLFGR